MNRNDLCTFDKQITSFIEYQYNTEHLISDLNSKISRLYKVLELKRKFLMDTGSNKYKLSGQIIYKKMVLAKMHFDNQKYFDIKAKNSGEEKRVSLKEGTTVAKIQLDTSLKTIKNVSNVVTDNTINTNCELLTSNRVNLLQNEDDEQFDQLLSQLDFSQYSIPSCDVTNTYSLVSSNNGDIQASDHFEVLSTNKMTVKQSRNSVGFLKAKNNLPEIFPKLLSSTATNSSTNYKRKSLSSGIIKTESNSSKRKKTIVKIGSPVVYLDDEIIVKPASKNIRNNANQQIKDCEFLGEKTALDIIMGNFINLLFF